MTEDKNLVPANEQALQGYTPGVNYGFEETNSEDIIIPRIKVINALSPERLDGIAVEGDVLNSLTQENISGLRFIPIKQYYSNICWNPDRDAEQRIMCRSFDGKIGQDDDGSLPCITCGKNKFDNTKTGKDSQPTCTSYLNFLGFFAGNPMPVVLSFAKTNYNEGRKMLSIAKSMRSSIWDYSYTLTGKQITKDKNRWYIIVPQMDTATTADERALAFELFKAYSDLLVKADYEDTGYSESTDGSIDTTTAQEI